MSRQAPAPTAPLARTTRPAMGDGRPSPGRRACLASLPGLLGLTTWPALSSLSALAALVPSAQAAGTLDLLDRPAPTTARGPTRLLLDVTSGGPGLVAVGEMGLILASSDGGASWRQLPSPTSVMLTAVAFADARHGWAVGHDGVVLGTTDGGARWTRQFDGRQANEAVLKAAKDQLAALQAAAQAAPKAVLKAPGTAGGPKAEAHAAGGAHAAADAGDSAEAASPLAQAEDALASAEDAVKAGPSRPLLALHVFDARRVVVAGAFGQLFATDDGGAHWRYLGQELPNPEGLHLYGLSVDPQGALLVAGEQGVVFVEVVGASASAGDRSAATDGVRRPDRPAVTSPRWRRSETSYNGNLHGVVALAGNGGGTTEAWLAYGFNGHLFRSTDRGAHWSAVAASPSPKTWVQATRHGDTLWMLAEDGGLFVTSDGGQSFRTAPPGALAARRYAGFILDETGDQLVAVGQGGVQRLPLKRTQALLRPVAPLPPAPATART